jgi:hypothetical protein
VLNNELMKMNRCNFGFLGRGLWLRTDARVRPASPDMKYDPKLNFSFALRSPTRFLIFFETSPQEVSCRISLSWMILHGDLSGIPDCIRSGWRHELDFLSRDRNRSDFLVTNCAHRSVSSANEGARLHVTTFNCIQTDE